MDTKHIEHMAVIVGHLKVDHQLPDPMIRRHVDMLESVGMHWLRQHYPELYATFLDG
jgi:hypothetical protein